MLKAVIVIITIKMGATGDEYHQYLLRDVDLKSPRLDLQCKYPPPVLLPCHCFIFASSHCICESIYVIQR